MTCNRIPPLPQNTLVIMLGMNLEQLTPDELDTHVENGTFRLAFVGMSNAGKTYRSKVLERELGFMWYHVDGEIGKTLGFSNISEISDWLGYPNSPQYEEHAQKYLELENKLTKVDTLDTDGKNLVFDTTGSVVHLESETTDWLKEYCLIVHLAVDESAVDTLIERFFNHPKPVIWGGYFAAETDENETAALRRCYPKLLKDRMEKYTSLAHVDIPALEFRDQSGEETLKIIKRNL